MPTYIYKFIDTGETIEVQQAFTDDALTEAAHPSTGAAMPVKKVFLPVGVTFKGGGFYKTDSRGGSGSSSSNGSGAPSTTSPDSAGSSSSTSDAGSGSGSSSSTTSPAPAAAPAVAAASSGSSTSTSSPS